MRIEMTVNSRPPNARLGRWARAVAIVLGVGLLGVGSVACAKAQAKGAPAGPPPRVLAPVEEPVVAVAPEPAPEPVAVPPRTPPRPPARRVETERPEPAPAAAAPVDAAAAEPRELRPASPALDATADKEVRDTLARAARDLGRVDYGRLSAAARAQYDQSKRFTQQAEQALKDRNFVFAATLADKAATLAAELIGR